MSILRSKHFHKPNKFSITNPNPYYPFSNLSKIQKKYNRLNPYKERVRWESEEGEGFQINLETHVMVPVAVSCHLTTLLNLTLILTPTLTTSTSKWFSVIAMAATRTKKWSKTREPRCGSKTRESRHGSKSKSNKHLWEQISSEMREKGFDRSATMCTDKWRNLL